jgi:hypothetical protein
MNNGELVYLVSSDFFNELSADKGEAYALDICGESVFGAILHDEGDPTIETTSTCIANLEWFNLFLDELYDADCCTYCGCEVRR